jgi:hypothetical protein
MENNHTTTTTTATDTEYQAPDSLIEYIYVDDTYVELNLDNLLKFLGWLHITKTVVDPSAFDILSPMQSELLGPPNLKLAATTTGEVAEVLECPICMENKSNLIALKHAVGTIGDVSSHRMCEDCLVHYTKNECPFCKGNVQTNPMPAFIHDFIHMLQNIDYNDANLMAAAFEEWQVYELTISESPAMTRQAAHMMITDEYFQQQLRDGVTNRSGWLRDAAGIFFRLYGMFVDGELSISEELGEVLTASIAVVLTPFEDEHRPVQLHGHYYGALYQQILTAWSCALSSGTSTVTLAQLIKRVGKAVAHCYRIHGKTRHSQRELQSAMRERLQRDVVEMAKQRVWQREADVIWTLLYK